MSVKSERGETFAGYTELEVEVCTCGVLFAAPKHMLDARRHDGKSFYCPNGHCLSYEGDRKRLERDLEKAQQREHEANQRRLAERELREHTERQLSAQKGATTKARKRHAAGLCPVCNRSFSSLREHIKTKHPDYDPARA